MKVRKFLILVAACLAATLLLAPAALAEPRSIIPGADAAITKAESRLGTDEFGI